VLSKMLDAIFDTIKNGELSSFHCLFPNENLPEHSLIQRIDCQFHWFNENFSSFEDFLDTLTSRKRKNIRKEREKIGNQGFIVDIVEGENLTTSDWHAFYNLYRQTYLKRSGHNGYLNEAFFQMLGTVLKNQTIIVRARRKQHDVWCAAALYFKDNKTLYGRYWGAINEYDSLHFECCYYQGIEYAIRHRLQRFDPGTQGEHKIARGFTPILTQSFHYIKHRILNEAVYDFLQKEKQDVIHYCDSARTLLPFQQGHALQSPFSLIDSSGKNNDVQNK
jgi:predicted N-acyltransferase